MRDLPRFWLIPALLLMIGCGGAGDNTETANNGATADQGEQAAAADSLAESFNFNEQPHLSEVDIGQFEAFWPSGCGKMRTRVIEQNSETSEYMAVEATCDCFGRQDFGVKVTVYLEMPDGNMPGPENVTAGIQSQIQALGLKIVKQVKADRDGMDGVAVYCNQQDGVGVVWMEGYLYQGKILHTMAWGPDGSLYSNEEIIQFMRSARFVEEYF